MKTLPAIRQAISLTPEAKQQLDYLAKLEDRNHSRIVRPLIAEEYERVHPKTKRDKTSK